MFTGVLTIVNSQRYASAKTITLVMYNLNTHRPGVLYGVFEPKHRLKRFGVGSNSCTRPSTVDG